MEWCLCMLLLIIVLKQRSTRTASLLPYTTFFLSPNSRFAPRREFAGKRLVRHIATVAAYATWRSAGFVARDTGITEATDGLAGAKVIRVADGIPAGAARAMLRHDGELLFLFVLRGCIDRQSVV